MENKHLNNLEYKQSMLEKSLSDMCPHQSQSCEIVGDYIMKKIALLFLIFICLVY